MWRDDYDDPLFPREAYCKRAAWADLQRMAAWRAETVIRDHGAVAIEVGQLATSWDELAARWAWNRKTVAAFLTKLKAAHFVDFDTKRAGTVITVTNGLIQFPNNQTDLNTSARTVYPSGPQSGPQKSTQSGPQETPTSGPQTGFLNNSPSITNEIMLLDYGPQEHAAIGPQKTAGGGPKSGPQLHYKGIINNNTPLPPKRGKLSVRDKKLCRVETNTPMMIRIGTWFGRQENTLWSLYEEEALDAAGEWADEDLELLEAYYTAPGKEDRPLRREVSTLLNNRQGELDRARSWCFGPGKKIVRFGFQKGDPLSAEAEGGAYG